MAALIDQSQHDLWSSVLVDLKLQMTQATFDAWLSNSHASLTEKKLTVFTRNEHGRDWIKNRLHHIIQRAVDRYSPGLDIDYAVQPRQGEMNLELAGTYKDDYARVVKPDKVFVGTQYFREIWLPILGPARAWLIVELRQRCYWNKATGEIRNKCQATYSELAATCGISESTAKRLLKEGPLINRFILNRRTLRRFDGKTGKWVNQSTQWTIRLDEPIYDPEMS